MLSVARLRHEIRDRIREILVAEGLEIKRVGPKAPNLNSVAERFVLSARSEAFDKLICLGETHLRYILTEWLDYYHRSRPHQGKDNKPHTGDILEQPSTILADDVVCEERLGGLLKCYKRAA